MDSVRAELNQEAVSGCDILRYYGSVNEKISKVELVSIDRCGFTLRYHNEVEWATKVVSAPTPLLTAETAIVQYRRLANTAAYNLGVSPEPVTTFFMPRGRARYVFGLFVGLMVLFISVTFVPLANEVFQSLVPISSKNLYKLLIVTMAFALSAHVAEIPTVLVPLLRYFRVPGRTQLVYIALTAFCGFSVWEPLRSRKKRELCDFHERKDIN